MVPKSRRWAIELWMVVKSSFYCSVSESMILGSRAPKVAKMKSWESHGYIRSWVQVIMCWHTRWSVADCAYENTQKHAQLVISFTHLTYRGQARCMGWLIEACEGAAVVNMTFLDGRLHQIGLLIIIYVEQSSHGSPEALLVWSGCLEGWSSDSPHSPYVRSHMGCGGLSW